MLCNSDIEQGNLFATFHFFKVKVILVETNTAESKISLSVIIVREIIYLIEIKINS